jgi:hypothetical protein
MKPLFRLYIFNAQSIVLPFFNHLDSGRSTTFSGLMNSRNFSRKRVVPREEGSTSFQRHAEQNTFPVNNYQSQRSVFPCNGATVQRASSLK